METPMDHNGFIIVDPIFRWNSMTFIIVTYSNHSRSFIIDIIDIRSFSPFWDDGISLPSGGEASWTWPKEVSKLSETRCLTYHKTYDWPLKYGIFQWHMRFYPSNDQVFECNKHGDSTINWWGFKPEWNSVCSSKSKRDGLPNQDGGSKTDLWHFMTQKISNIEKMFFFSHGDFFNQAQLSYNNIDMMGYDGIFTLYATYGGLDIYIYIYLYTYSCNL